MDFRWPEGKHVAVSLTFDDARPSQIDHGLPLLREYGVPATFYCVPDNVKERRAGWRGAAQAGHEIGNHTMTHPCSVNFAFSRQNGLESYSLETIEQELLGCNQQLTELCGVIPRTFAYPCGQTFVGRGAGTASYVPLVARHFLAGRGFPSEYHNVPSVCDLAQLNGRSFDQVPFESIKAWIEAAREETGWLILVGHDIGPESGWQTVSLEALRAVCEYSSGTHSGIWLDSVASIGQYVQDWQREGLKKG